MKIKKPICYLLINMMLLCTHFLNGQIGVLSICDDLTMSSNGSIEMEIKDLSGAGLGNDQIDVTGDVFLDGTLDILLSGYEVDNGDSFELLTYGGILTGTFSTINWPDDMINQGWTIDYGFLYPGTITIYVPGVVPVEFLSFDLLRIGEENKLRWVTASENNNDYFAIEHSMDGISFDEIGVLESNKSGSTNQEYNFIHSVVQYGLHYYRLRQVDLDGHFTVSNTLVVFIEGEKDIVLFPNPSSGHISFSKQVNGFELYDQTGKLIMRTDESVINYDLSLLASGQYHVVLKGTSLKTLQLFICK